MAYCGDDEAGMKDNEVIKNAAESNTSTYRIKKTFGKKGTGQSYLKVGKLLEEWIEQKRLTGGVITGKIIREKANDIAKINHIIKFKSSNAWLMKFMRKCKIPITDEDKEFVCDHCGKRFVANSCRELHQTIHTGEKPFSCRVCLKLFRLKTHLETHERMHSGEKPYFCDLCGKGYYDRSNFKKHACK